MKMKRAQSDLRGQIDRALELGYDVLVIRLWDMDPYQLEVATGMVASSGRIQALRGMLREDYVATQEPVGSKALVERHNLRVSPATVRNRGLSDR